MPQALVNSLSPGWFGKMPALGDFASRRLPQAFIDGWDSWLQRELPRSQGALGAAWLDAFLVAPVRRYWLAAGLLDAQAWAGVWMPSVDSAGRHFPFTVAAPCAAAGAWPLAHDHAAWFDALDAAARQALDPDAGPDLLEQALAALRAPAVRAPAVRESGSRPGVGSAWWCAGTASTLEIERFGALPAGAGFDLLLQPCR